MSRVMKYLTVVIAFALALPTAALAAVDPVQTGQWSLSTTQLTTLIVGALVPIVTYVLNHIGPWLDEKTKAAVLIVVSAVAGGLWQAIEVGGVGWNDQTLQFVITAIIGALTAHNFFYRPAGINTALGGGSNKQD